MPKKQPASKKAKKIPRHGRSQSDVRNDMGLQDFAGNVSLGGNDPTVRFGVMYGGMPNFSRMARGGLREFRGKYT